MASRTSAFKDGVLELALHFVFFLFSFLLSMDDGWGRDGSYMAENMRRINGINCVEVMNNEVYDDGLRFSRHCIVGAADTLMPLRLYPNFRSSGFFSAILT